MVSAQQNTVLDVISLTGVGLHSGADIHLSIKPAETDTGIVFIRSDITKHNNVIPAKWDHVVDTKLCTVIANEEGASVGTIEHIMSALCGLGIDNAVIELDGAEVPVLDGSALPFIKAIEEVGVQSQDAKRKVIRVLKDVSVEKDGKRVTLSPSDIPTYMGEIDFDHPEIGTQHYSLQLLNGNFKHQIADARTFGFLSEVSYLRSIGLAQGGSLENAIVLDDDKVLNEDGLRYKDEFIRHKILDAIGDLYLAGAAIQGQYEGSKAGHEMNNAILHALFADESAWEYA